jgi:SAM-dependent methyltransferase
MKSLLKLLREPELENLDVDDPKTFEIHRQFIKRKPLLRDVYASFYGEFVRISEEVPPGRLVELGSGGGFIKEYLPSVITSDIFHLPELDAIFSAENIGFHDSTISAFFLFDVFHHLADPRRFFQEAQRCLKPGGRLVMIEPANTFWGRLIRKNFHHESHDETAGWGLDGSKPMSDANLALPWIVFVRDREIFQREFPNLSIMRYEPHTPLRFLLSGGITYRSLVPRRLIPLVKVLEYGLSPFNRFLGMHVTIDIRKLSNNAGGKEGHFGA